MHDTIPRGQAALLGDRGMRRDVGFVGLLFVSLGSIIGSGWLLGALGATETAGPAAIVSWVIAGAIVVVLALVHAEVGAAYPVSGGTARFPHYAFGSLAGFTAGWMSWIGSVTLAPIEVEAALQYLTNISWLSWLTHTSGGTPVLTAGGYGVAVGLLAVFSAVNLLGVRRFAKTNTWAVWWKTAIPLLTIVVLFVDVFHSGNFDAGGGFAPFGVKGIFAALPAGVVFAYLGFEQAIQLGAESRDPQRHVAPAVIGSIAIGIVIYLLLEVVFVGALRPGSLAHGWSDPMGKGAFGPYASLAKGAGLAWLAAILYVDAFISPAGTGLVYTGTSSRLTFALGRNGYIPPVFERLNSRGVPAASIAFSFVVGLFMFLPFPGWQKLVGFVTSATALMYAFTPLAFGALRRQEPERPRPYRLRGGQWWAPVSFVAANLIFYWGGWTTNWRLLAAVAVGYLLMGASYLVGSNRSQPALDWRNGSWLAPYLGGMALISWLGQYDGRQVIPLWWDIVVVAVFSLAIYALAMRLRLSPDHVRRYVEETP